MDFKILNAEQIAAATEIDAGQAVECLRTALQQAKAGEYAVHSPEAITARRGRPVGSLRVEPLKSGFLRLDAAMLAALRATAKGWQSRAASVLAKYAVGTT